MIGLMIGFRTGFTDALASLACPRQAAWQKKRAQNNKKLLHLILGYAILKVRWTKQ